MRLLIILIIFFGTVNAGTHRCIDANGNITYSQIGCDGEAGKIKIAKEIVGMKDERKKLYSDEIKRRKAENDEHDRQRKIEEQKIRVEEAIKLIAENNDRIQHQKNEESSYIQSETELNSTLPDTIKQRIDTHQGNKKLNEDDSHEYVGMQNQGYFIVEANKMTVFVWIFIVVLIIGFYVTKYEKARVYEQAKLIEKMGFAGYDDAIILFSEYREKDAEVLLKKWIYENDSKKFKEKIIDLESCLNAIDIELNYDEKDVISTAKLEASSFRAYKVVSQYEDILRRKYNQLVYKDEYGNLILEDWDSEFSYFFEDVLTKNTDYKASVDLYVRPFFYRKSWQWAKANAPTADSNLLEGLVQEKVDLQIDYFGIYNSKRWIELLINVDDYLDSSNNDIEPVATPYEYEKYCEKQLIKGGWDATVKKIGADQGVDIVATINNFRLGSVDISPDKVKIFAIFSWNDK